MTDDIVARLRWWKGEIGELFEAADKIERLKNQISHIIEHNNPQIEQANSYFKLLEEELARCNKIIDDYEEEHSRLREENAELREENARLRAALERIAQHDMQAIAMDALRPGERIRPAKEVSDDAAT